MAGIKSIIGPGIGKQKKWLTCKNFLSEEDQKQTYSDQSQKFLKINSIKLNNLYPEIEINTSVFEEKEMTGNIIEINSNPFSFKISISESYLKEILDIEGNLVLNTPTGIIQPYPRNYRGVAKNSKERLINICNYLIEKKELPLIVENIVGFWTRREIPRNIESGKTAFVSSGILSISISFTPSQL